MARKKNEGEKTAGPALELPPSSTAVYYLGRKPETTAARVRRLQAEAEALARQQILAMEEAMNDLARRAGEIAVGGDAYPIGAREMASRLAEDLPLRVTTLQMIMGRTKGPKF